MDEKLKSENMQKSFVCLCYILRTIREGRSALYSDILQNAPFRSQIFKIFFASGGKGALIPRNQNPAEVPVSLYGAYSL